MRLIDNTLKTKLLKLQSTAYENNQPSMQTEIVRPETPIKHKRYWQESIVAPVNATSVSTAIRRTTNAPDRAYVAYVAGGTLYVMSGALAFPAGDIAWIPDATISGVIACALAFDGDFEELPQGRATFYTGAKPWLFYVTSGGVLMAGLLGETYTQIADNVSALDAVRGVQEYTGEEDTGLVAFYVRSGSVFYRQRVAGVWGDQNQITEAPAGAVSIRSERTFDWRIVLQIRVSDGRLFEVFTKPYYSGWIAIERLSSKANITAVTVHEIQRVNTNDVIENLTAGGRFGFDIRLREGVPQIVDVWNIETTPGEFGKQIIVKLSDPIFGDFSALSSEKLIGDNGLEVHPTKIEKLPFQNRLLLTFADFNNLTNPITFAYTPGDWTTGFNAVPPLAFEFVAQNLDPTHAPGPLLTHAEAISDKQVVLTFDKALSEAGGVTGLSLTGFEPNTAPQGEVSEVEYEISGTTIDGNELTIDLTHAGRIKYPVGGAFVRLVGTLHGADGTFAAPFYEQVDVSDVVPYFNPNAPEIVTLSAVFAFNVSSITSYTQHVGETIITRAGLSVNVIKVGNLPL